MANRVLGAGRIHFARRVDGVLGPMKLIAETPSLAYSVKTERVKEYSSDGPIAEVDVDVATKVDRDGKFVCKDISDYNLALHLIATASSVTTAAATVTGSAINGGVALAADSYYQLGLTTHSIVGVRGIEDIAIKTSGTTYTLGTGYTLPYGADVGIIYIPAGSPAIGAICTADYDTTVATWGQVASVDTGAPEGQLRFVADNTQGANRDYLFTDVVLMGDGEASLKDRAKTQELGFSFSIRKPSTGSAVYINGRPE